MHESFRKPYSPIEKETDVYELWEKSGYFNPDKSPKNNGGFYSIVLPPPNVTGKLHTGHALMIAIGDAIVRFQRMRGKKVLWLPGTDHAAIATQTKVEEDLYKNEKKIRNDFSREDFVAIVKKYASDSHSNIVNQIKKLGASLDWSREAYTLDEKRGQAVIYAFSKMYADGLIYRGSRIVNWDPKLQTTLSDEEVDRKEESTPLYYLKYGPFVIATARPETKFGDKYVVMHPDDKRYQKFSHREMIELEWINGPIKATIIKDPAVDMEFGTGVMTITPNHDLADFEMAERHKLDKEQIIDFDGKLMPIADEFFGIHIKKARLMIVEKLRKKGLVEKIDENYIHSVAVNSRGGGIIEPQIKEQWFISVTKKFRIDKSKIRGIADKTEISLKEIMLYVVENDLIEIYPERFKKTYLHWIRNLRDWCISRQLWYGHQIPAWFRDADGKNEIYVGEKPPNEEGWQRDADTLDTWFSSGLWTFSTLGWPAKTKDLENFHPTDLLETGYDILFFWVARMILMSSYHIHEIPFKKVYLHGLVRDEKGRKMSKSLGNIIDPLLYIEKYGADALRMALIVGNAPGNDINLGENKIRGYKHFANKIWNASRFVIENTSEYINENKKLEDSEMENILKDFRNFSAEVTRDIENLQLHIASEKIYHYFWKTFADIVIEKAKNWLKQDDKKESVALLLNTLLKKQLVLLHPFMPFVTESIWQLYYSKQDGNSEFLIAEKWPT